jgi:hypothetical protein
MVRSIPAEMKVIVVAAFNRNSIGAVESRGDCVMTTEHAEQQTGQGCERSVPQV